MSKTENDTHLFLAWQTRTMSVLTSFRAYICPIWWLLWASPTRYSSVTLASKWWCSSSTVISTPVTWTRRTLRAASPPRISSCMSRPNQQSSPKVTSLCHCFYAIRCERYRSSKTSLRITAVRSFMRVIFHSEAHWPIESKSWWKRELMSSVSGRSVSRKCGERSNNIAIFRQHSFPFLELIRLFHST